MASAVALRLAVAFAVAPPMACAAAGLWVARAPNDFAQQRHAADAVFASSPGWADATIDEVRGWIDIVASADGFDCFVFETGWRGDNADKPEFFIGQLVLTAPEERAFDRTVQQVRVIDGRMPERPDEVLLGVAFAEGRAVKVDDSLTFKIYRDKGLDRMIDPGPRFPTGDERRSLTKDIRLSVVGIGTWPPELEPPIIGGMPTAILHPSFGPTHEELDELSGGMVWLRRGTNDVRVFQERLERGSQQPAGLWVSRDHIDTASIPLRARGITIGLVGLAWLVSALSVVLLVRRYPPARRRWPLRVAAAAGWFMVTAVIGVAATALVPLGEAGRLGRPGTAYVLGAAGLAGIAGMAAWPFLRHRSAGPLKSIVAVAMSGTIALGAAAAGWRVSETAKEFVATPAEYGVNWKLEEGFNYAGELLPAIKDYVEHELAATGAVDLARLQQNGVFRLGTGSVGPLRLSSEGRTATAQTMAFSRHEAFGVVEVHPTQGRDVAADDEIVLGRRTAARLGASEGSTVKAHGPSGEQSLTVVGIARFPVQGVMARVDEGARVSFKAWKALFHDARNNVFWLDLPTVEEANDFHCAVVSFLGLAPTCRDSVVGSRAELRQRGLPGRPHPPIEALSFGGSQSFPRNAGGVIAAVAMLSTAVGLWVTRRQRLALLRMVVALAVAPAAAAAGYWLLGPALWHPLAQAVGAT